MISGPRTTSPPANTAPSAWPVVSSTTRGRMISPVWIPIRTANGSSAADFLMPTAARTAAGALAKSLLAAAGIDVDLTPNRGDCFSILGIAREVAALTGKELKSTTFPSVAATIEDTHPVEVEVPAGCPNVAGRVIRNIDPAARSPVWMAEKLRRAGLRPIRDGSVSPGVGPGLVEASHS